MATKKKKKASKEGTAPAEKASKAAKGTAEKPGKKVHAPLTGKAAKLAEKLVKLEETYEAEREKALQELAAELPEGQHTFTLEDGRAMTMCERNGNLFLRTNNPNRSHRGESAKKKKVGKKKSSKK